MEGINSPLSGGELRAALSGVERSTKTGEDVKIYETLKLLPDEYLDLLLEEISRVWDEGSLTPQWKGTLIIPVPKPGKQPNSVDNFRPLIPNIARRNNNEKKKDSYQA